MFIIYLFHLIFQPFLELIMIYNYKTYKDLIVHWSNSFLTAWKCKIYKVSNQNIIHKKKLIYFSNHRSWADFVFDHITTEFSTKFISRIAVIMAQPFGSIIALLSNTIYFINRSTKNIKKMFDSIYKLTKNDIGVNLLVYPEGTRRYDALQPTDLKRGFIYYAFDHDYDIQFIISKNKEQVFNEKKCKVTQDQNIYVYYSKAYSPSKFKQNGASTCVDEQRNAFYNYINLKWKKEWNIVFHTKQHKKLIKPVKIDPTFSWNNNNIIPVYHKIAIYSILSSILFCCFYFLF